MADTVIALIKDFPLVDSTTHQPVGSEATQGIVITTMQSLATPTTGGSKMYRMDPVSAVWVRIPYSTGTGSKIAADEASATVDGDATISGTRPAALSIMSMPDAVVFPRGVPSATGRAGMSTEQTNDGQINQPVFVWTNNYDPVFVYPRANGVLEYEPLTNQFGIAGDPCDFRCVSLEVFADRVNFFNTAEGSGANMVRRRNRLRWSARGTADPTPTVGASSLDLDNFSGQGVKIRRLGNVMACYLQDGVAIISQTGQAAAPYGVQSLDERRGLLSTHGLVSISDNEHFGVFDDGWWILDSSGRWRECGVVSMNGTPVRKWKSFFYSVFNRTVSHRLQCYYEEAHNWIRMAVPVNGNDARVTEEWIYDIESDRVWKDRYNQGLSTWGDITLRSDETTTLIWSDASMRWDEIEGSWASFGSSIGEQRMCHGDELGFVFFHDDTIITRDGEDPLWSYETAPSSLSGSLSIKTGDRLSMEHVSAGNPAGASLAVTTGSGTSALQVKSLDLGDPGDSVRTQSFHHISDERLGFSVSGSGPISIRSFTLDYVEDEVEMVAS